MVHCPLTELMLITFLFMEVESDAPTATIRTKGQCTCITNDGAEYNLMPLGRSDGIPRFNVRSSRETSVNYTYNPCTPVTLPEGAMRTFCYQVALCKISGGWMYQGIGLQGGVKCKIDRDGVVKLVYPLFGNYLTSSVLLICDPEKKTLKQAVFKPLNDGTLTFVLIHSCACPNGCPSAVKETVIQGKQKIIFSIFIVSIVALCVLVGLGCHWRSRHVADNNGRVDERKPILEQGERRAKWRQEDENDIGRASGDRVGYKVILREHADPRRGYTERNGENVPIENVDVVSD